jgi:hypothetical protein
MFFIRLRQACRRRVICDIDGRKILQKQNEERSSLEKIPLPLGFSTILNPRHELTVFVSAAMNLVIAGGIGGVCALVPCHIRLAVIGVIMSDMPPSTISFWLGQDAAWCSTSPSE